MPSQMMLARPAGGLPLLDECRLPQRSASWPDQLEPAFHQRLSLRPRELLV